MPGTTLLSLYESEVGTEFPEIWQLHTQETPTWDYLPNSGEPSMYKLLQLRKQWHARTTPFPLLWRRIGLISYLGLPTPPSGAQCSDPRDRIYSLLSLADAAGFAPNPLYPDYARSATSLLVELVERDWRKMEAESTFKVQEAYRLEYVGFKGLEKRA